MPDADIVVVGRREKQSDGSYLISYRIETGIPGIKFLTPRNVSEDSTLEEDIEVAVKIEKTKSETDQTKLELAAQKLIAAAIKLVAQLQMSNRTDFVVVLDKLINVGEMLDTLLNTHFTVTDVTNFNNNGVGSAQRGAAGQPNQDAINYQAIIGGGIYGNGYADDGFPDYSGMLALVLHEVAHMTQAGFDFFTHSFEVAGDEGITGSQFYQSEYATNLEAFANDVMTEISWEIGVDLHGVRPGTSAPSVTPESIYQSHTGNLYSG